MLGELDRLRDDFAVEFSAELEDPLPRKGQSKALDAVRAKRLAWRDARFIEYHERLSRTYTAIHDRDEAFITYDVQTLEAVSDRFEEIADLWQHYRDENEAQRHRGNPNRGF